MLPPTGDENHSLSAIVMACVAGGCALAVVARARAQVDKLHG